jgi:UDP-N-acetylglucosamine transferase subunit ALG13
MIFITVGTYPLQFNRLIKAVDIAVRDGLIKEEIFAQTGACNYKPVHMEYASMLEKSEFDARFKDANSIIGHAGMGTISMALEQNKPILIIARMSKYKEHVNDHQVSTADMFEKLGHVLVAHNTDELPQKLSKLNTFIPAKRNTTPHLVADRVAEFLVNMQHQ